ncbi:MAG: hypothetical protein R3261_00365 [Alphaproteobacteria bacterium]|nr:hypothetical protein [Alphaproteobacteria bacterium]
MIFRWLGKICIILAMLLLLVGIYVWLSGADINQAGGVIWYQMHQESLQLTQVVIERYLHASWFWTFFQNNILTLPAWDGLLRVFITLMIIGGFLVGLFKKSAYARRKSSGLK